MLNFRKLKQDLSPSIVSEGQTLFDEGMVVSAKILHFDGSSVRVGASIKGAFDNFYESEVEINRSASEVADSNCDCSYRFDCQHLAAVLFYLERHLNQLLVDFSKESESEGEAKGLTQSVKEGLEATLKQVEKRESARRGRTYERELLAEYGTASAVLGSSIFFLPESELSLDRAELAVIFSQDAKALLEQGKDPEIQIALRLPSRSKPLYVPNIREFLEGIRYREPLLLSGRRYFFTLDSFEEDAREILLHLLDSSRFLAPDDERGPRVAELESKVFGMLLARAYEMACARLGAAGYVAQQGERLAIPYLYQGSLEKPLTFSPSPAALRFVIELFEAHGPKLFLKPTIVVDEGVLLLSDLLLLECAKPGLIYQETYYRFQPKLLRLHLRDVAALRDITIPEPLFGSFVENALPELMRYAEVSGHEKLEKFVTLPYIEELCGSCLIEYLDGELEARLTFRYGDREVPAISNQLTYELATSFISEEGILARNLVEERAIIQELFDGFTYRPEEGAFIAKTEKKIVEFMTEVVPRHQGRIAFECPQNLLDQFLYDDTRFTLTFKEGPRFDCFIAELKVDGHLKGVTLDRLWDVITSKRNFIELDAKSPIDKKGRRTRAGQRLQKTLVLDLDRLTPLVQLFDEIGLKTLDDHEQERPLWSLASVQSDTFAGLPVEVHISPKLQEIQKQILGESALQSSPIPTSVCAELHNYQVEGVHWLERLRRMHLSGILADDMGLGKTVQAITAITQHVEEGCGVSLVVCPTSLVYNWDQEIQRFNPKLKTLVIDGAPALRKRLLAKASKVHIIITSYSLLQKDIELYESIPFAYAILDEAQHIKNRGTRNAKSVKRIQAAHRLILTGTPIENSLEELWSLFDFLMPGLLSTYERFVERYLRAPAGQEKPCLELLQRKVAPFILRRMKSDVLEDLPPVSEQVYYCHLSKVQRDLYQSYAASAREELSRLVQREGFDKIQIHVLATLTRLKQICCHPAIFAKEAPEEGDSAKYDMMLELLHSLIEGRHKTVIFSQYTQMLKIMRDDLERLGIRFAYLDGSTKNRMDVVKSFNEDTRILVFLVSLKAGGTGLNLVSADVVIHFDLWWNPAVQEQATDRVHRIGQERPVSSFKLVTLGTIEEKVLELQRRKSGLVKQVVSSDDEVVSKLTWEEVLELLQV